LGPRLIFGWYYYEAGVGFKGFETGILGIWYLVLGPRLIFGWYYYEAGLGFKGFETGSLEFGIRSKTDFWLVLL
jgi:hypothetical protein